MREEKKKRERIIETRHQSTFDELFAFAAPGCFLSSVSPFFFVFFFSVFYFSVFLSFFEFFFSVFPFFFCFLFLCFSSLFSLFRFLLLYVFFSIFLFVPSTGGLKETVGLLNKEVAV